MMRRAVIKTYRISDFKDGPKKSVKADSLEAIKAAARDVFKYASSQDFQVIQDEDETVIEEDDYLLSLPDLTDLYLVRNGERNSIFKGERLFSDGDNNSCPCHPHPCCKNVASVSVGVQTDDHSSTEIMCNVIYQPDQHGSVSSPAGIGDYEDQTHHVVEEDDDDDNHGEQGEILYYYDIPVVEGTGGSTGIKKVLAQHDMIFQSYQNQAGSASSDFVDPSSGRPVILGSNLIPRGVGGPEEILGPGGDYVDATGKTAKELGITEQIKEFISSFDVSCEVQVNGVDLPVAPHTFGDPDFPMKRHVALEMFKENTFTPAWANNRILPIPGYIYCFMVDSNKSKKHLKQDGVKWKMVGKYKREEVEHMYYNAHSGGILNKDYKKVEYFLPSEFKLIVQYLGDASNYRSLPHGNCNRSRKHKQTAAEVLAEHTTATIHGDDLEFVVDTGDSLKKRKKMEIIMTDDGLELKQQRRRAPSRSFK